VGSLYPDLSDDQLLERLKAKASAAQCELVEEEREPDPEWRWQVAFKRFDQPKELAPNGVIVHGAESPNRRIARETLLYQVERL
jgi:hypothetical protein